MSNLPCHPLSEREMQVLDALANGADRSEAGAQLGISPLTIKTHLDRIRDRLGVHTTLHAYALAAAGDLILFADGVRVATTPLRLGWPTSVLHGRVGARERLSALYLPTRYHGPRP